MKKIKFWLEVDEAKNIYRQVECVSAENDQLIIRFLDNDNLGKRSKDIVLDNSTTLFTSKYIKILGYEKTSEAKTYVLKGYYLYTLKPYIKPSSK